MSWLEALILGVVEGITEYLPVSSTGHLLLTQRALGIASGDAANAFAISIQAGAIVAVLGLYWRRVQQMFNGVLGKDRDGLKLAVNIIIAFAPAVVAGLFLEDLIKHYLFGEAWGLWPVVAAWFAGGVLILIVAVFRKQRKKGSGLPLERLGFMMALGIGLWQCLAMWPGVSRSLATIVGGVVMGLSLAAAVEFSFLLGVVTLGAATAYDFIKHMDVILGSYGVWPVAIGFLSAWVSAVIAVKWMVSYLQKHGLQIFGYYRIILALAVAALLLMGYLSPESAPANGN